MVPFGRRHTVALQLHHRQTGSNTDGRLVQIISAVDILTRGIYSKCHGSKRHLDKSRTNELYGNRRIFCLPKQKRMHKNARMLRNVITRWMFSARHQCKVQYWQWNPNVCILNTHGVPTGSGVIGDICNFQSNWRFQHCLDLSVSTFL